MRKKTVILFLVLTSAACRLHSQLQFEMISSLQGLSSDKISDIIQDKDGFYWIGTSEGLNRFDGSTFKVYRHDKNDSTSLSSNTVNALMEDDNGDIWVGTIFGLNRLVKKTGTFKRYYFHHPVYTDNTLNRVFDFAKDNDGNIWIAAFGLWKINPANETIKGYCFDASDSTSVSDASQLHTIYFDKNRNGLWILTSGQINFFDIKTQQFFHHKNNPKQWPVFTLKNKRILNALDQTGRLWLYDHYENKLMFMDPSSNDYASITLTFTNDLAGLLIDHANNPVFTMELMNAIVYKSTTGRRDTLQYIVDRNIQKVNYRVNRYYTDRQNNVWLCTLNGLFVSRNSQKKYQVYSFGESEYHLPRSINALVVRKGHAWLGIGDRIYQYDLLHKRAKSNLHYPSPHELRPMFNDGDSLLWASAGNKLVIFDFNTRQIKHETVLEGGPYFLIRDSRNRFWLGTWAAGFYQLDERGGIVKHYTTKNGLKDNALVSGFSKGTDCLWLGFNGGNGFTRFDLTTGKFEDFLIRSGKTNSPETNIINTILADNHDNLWLGTYGGGLYYFDRKNNSFKNFQVQDGLSGDYINTLALDDSSNLWVSTSNGIDIFNAKSGSFYHINEQMRLNNNDHVFNLARDNEERFFYFATNKLIVIEPRLYAEASSNPNIVISDFKVYNKELPEPMSIKTISLPFNKNFFTVSFSVLKVSPTIPANYKYKLEGFDKNWIDAGERGSANYTNVPPGKYTLLLNATDETGRWRKEPVSVGITILPPFWKTWWFISLSSILALSILYLVYRYRIGQLKKVYLLRSKISQDLHDEVASTLSGIRLYSEMAKEQLMNKNTEAIQRSLEVISSNANEMAQDMSDIIWAINPSNDSFKKLLQKLKSYSLEISSASNMKFEYSNHDEFPEEKLNMQQRRNIYLICKEAVNNAVKYSGGKRLSMSVERSDHSIILTIVDDGRGFEKESLKVGNGLMNMRSRAREINAKLDISSKLKKGTSIELTVKLT